MKYTLALLALLIGLAVPSAAQANHPSHDYVEASLRGQTANAPDNDVKVYWDYVESVCKNAYGGAIDIQSSFIVASWYALAPDVPHYRRVTWQFNRSGGKTFTRQFDGYWSSSTTYHDGNYDSAYCPTP